MQIILAVIAFTKEFLIMYSIANIMLFVFKADASKKQKVLFSFLAGSVLFVGLIYFVYLLGGSISFSIIIFSLVTTPNPLAGLIYCYLAIKIFKLPPLRSTKIVSYIYLFSCLMKSLSMAGTSIFFMQTEEKWNFLLDAVGTMTMTVITLSICFLVLYILRKKRFNLDFADNRFFNPKKEVFFYFCKSLCAYFICTSIIIIVENQQSANVIAFLSLLLFLVILVSYDIISYNYQVIENSRIHINALFQSNEEFKGIKHDFNNILQTYSGYIEIGDLDKLRNYHNKLINATTRAESSLDLARRIEENPALCSLIIRKMEYADKLSVVFQSRFTCSLENSYIDNMDLCRIMACLLDNAIDAASISEQKKVHLTVEAKNNISKIIIITNSTDGDIEIDNILLHGVTTKKDHTGIGLPIVKKTIEKYGNCTFNLKYYNNEFSVYLELKKA